MRLRCSHLHTQSMRSACLRNSPKPHNTEMYSLFLQGPVCCMITFPWTHYSLPAFPFNSFQCSTDMNSILNYMSTVIREVREWVQYKDTWFDKVSLYLKQGIYYKHQYFISNDQKDWETSKTGLPALMNTAAHTLNMLHREVKTGVRSSPRGSRTASGKTPALVYPGHYL